MVQWLRIHSSSAGGVGSILDWGTKIPYAIKHGQKIKKKKKKKAIWDCKISSKPRIKEKPLWKKRTLFLTSNYFYNFSYSLSRTTPNSKGKKKKRNQWNPNQNPSRHFYRNWQANSKTHLEMLEMRGPRIDKITLKKTKKVSRLIWSRDLLQSYSNQDCDAGI